MRMRNCCECDENGCAVKFVRGNALFGGIAPINKMWFSSDPDSYVWNYAYRAPNPDIPGDAGLGVQDSAATAAVVMLFWANGDAAHFGLSGFDPATVVSTQMFDEKRTRRYCGYVVEENGLRSVEGGYEEVWHRKTVSIDRRTNQIRHIKIEGSVIVGDPDGLYYEWEIDDAGTISVFGDPADDPVEIINIGLDNSTVISAPDVHPRILPTTVSALTISEAGFLFTSSAEDFLDNGDGSRTDYLRTVQFNLTEQYDIADLEADAEALMDEIDFDSAGTIDLTDSLGEVTETRAMRWDEAIVIGWAYNPDTGTTKKTRVSGLPDGIGFFTFLSLVPSACERLLVPMDVISSAYAFWMSKSRSRYDGSASTAHFCNEQLPIANTTYIIDTTNPPTDPLPDVPVSTDNGGGAIFDGTYDVVTFWSVSDTIVDFVPGDIPYDFGRGLLFLFGNCTSVRTGETFFCQTQSAEIP